MVTDRFDEETMRLLQAFYQIADPRARRIIVSVVEAAAQGASVELELPIGMDERLSALER